MSAEPLATAVYFAVIGALLGASAILSRATRRLPIPMTLVFLGVGMLAGSDGIGGIPFNDFGLAFRAGSAALVFILFDGGLNTPWKSIRGVAAPAAVLASVGTAGMAALVAVLARWLGVPWPVALLLGAVVSSTDAAAIIGVLRGSGTHLQDRVGRTLETESGLNDPVAVILTTTLTANLLRSGGDTAWGAVALSILREVVIGGALGLAIGHGARWLLSRHRLPASGLYPVLTLSTALLAFAVPTMLHGSGFLSVYIAAVVLGSGNLPFRTSLLRVHDSLGWLSQVAMFLVLGLLVYPTRLLNDAGLGVLIAIGMAFIARPLVVAVCLLPFRYRLKEVGYIGWVGLRGAVPIILATFPVLSGAPGADRLFHLVFFIVVVNSVMPGSTVPWITRCLALESDEPPPPEAVLVVESHSELDGEILSFYVDEALDVAGATLADLPFPDRASVTMIVRGRELIAPKGATTLEVGDHVYVVAHPEDRAMVQLVLGRPESV